MEAGELLDNCPGVFVQIQQGKHVQGKWRGYGKGPARFASTFLSTFVSPNYSKFLAQMWKLAENEIRTTPAEDGRPNRCFFNCGKTKVGTRGETHVVLQWTRYKGTYYIHAYPEKQGRKGSFECTPDVDAHAKIK